MPFRKYDLKKSGFSTPALTRKREAPVRKRVHWDPDL